MTEDELQHTQKIVEDFRAGIGKTLHESLLKKIKGQRNWVRYENQRKFYKKYSSRGS